MIMIQCSQYKKQQQDLDLLLQLKFTRLQYTIIIKEINCGEMEPKNGKMLQYSLLLLLMFVNGCFVSSFGPLIPHFSAATGLDETHYSYLFFIRSAANIFGGFLIKFLLRNFTTQALIIFYQLFLTASLFASTLSLSTLNLSITLFLAASSLVGQVVLIYEVTFKMFLKDEPDYWIQLIGFVFGIGAMCGPLLVAIFKLETFKALAVVEIVAICAFIKFPLPEFIESSKNQQETEQKGMSLSQKSAFFISIVFFLFATEELGLASWISTYSIKAGVSDVNGSAIYSSLFWLPNCLGRLAWMYAPGNVQQRLGWALKGVIISLVATLIFQYFQLYQLVCVFTPITSGLLMAGVFGLGISWPVDKGFLPSSQNNANFLLANALGEGLLITPVGYSINLFGFKFLMIETCLFSYVSYWAYQRAIMSMQKDKQSYDNQLLQETI